ncbi:sensor histidine kinase [Candidatus Woesearchaeota archaeon]|nr:sensor histidine kinase [Candidatus Woesearchaeota archaeon]
MAAALGLVVKEAHCEKLEATSKHYLERMGLFRFLKIKSGMRIKEHEPAGRFIPLTRISDSGQLTKFLTEMVPLLHLEPKQAEPIRYVISELVRNVLEHSRSEHGAIVCAQYYKESNIIRIGIADTGVGIKSTINVSHEAPTHLEAIRLALTPGITGTTRREGGTEFNAGAGLFFIKSLACVSRDFFLIYSGNAMFKLLKTKEKEITLNADPLMDRHSCDEELPFWRGTVVGIDIALGATDEFELFLDLVREIYAKTVRERKKARFRRPKFI